MKECTSVTALARELGIRRKFLYKWKQELEEAASGKANDENPREQKVLELQRRIGELEQLSGRQALEIDFFRSALRRVVEARQSRDSNGGRASTPKSAAGCRRKAN